MQMKNPIRFVQCVFFFVLMAGFWLTAGFSADQGLALISDALAQVAEPPKDASHCGEPIRPLEFYDRISRYALIAGFVFILPAIVINNKKGKGALIVLGSVFLLGWGYLNFGINYQAIKKNIFQYSAAPPSGTLSF